MAIETFVDRPFPDLDTPDALDTAISQVTALSGDIVGPSGETEPIEDRLNAARGVLIALLICAPFWIGVFWLLS
jgi:hypothetical protein